MQQTIHRTLQSNIYLRYALAIHRCVPGVAGCSPIRTYDRLFVSEHGRLAGRHAMMSEIFARGPISCGIDATLLLDEYTGAPFSVINSI